MPESTFTSGRTIARYRILEEVGRGGMATVFRALDPTLGREVAVKVLHPHLASNQEARARLEREAQAVAKLRHDNILEIFDYSGADSPESFLVTEFIRGPTLTAFLEQHPPALPDVATMIAHELAAALSVAHHAGVIHRDIKPDNVMVRSDDGRLKLTDFGIAQVIDKERLTATGQLIGSPAYLAPELVEGGRVDFRTDVFSLGIVAYRVAAGELPFAGRNPHEMMKRIVEGRYPPPDEVNPAVSRGLCRIIARALARLPDDRYGNMEAMRRDLAAELAVAGITDVRAELARYFAGPEAWEKAARPRLVAALCEGARGELAGGRTAAALALVARALGLAPSDPAAKALFDRIGRRRRRGRLVVGVTALVAASGLGVAGLRSYPSPPAHLSENPTAYVAGAAVATAGQRRGPDAPGDPRATATAARTRIPQVAAVRPRPAAPAPLREVRINVIPKSAEIFVDGGAGMEWLPGQPLRLSPGRAHTVVVRNPACYDTTITIQPADVDLGLVRLRWKEAYLKVTTTPPSARVVVDPDNGEAREFDTAAQIPVLIPPRSQDGRERVLVEVSQKGFLTHSETIEVRAGQSRDLHIDLQPRP